MDNLKKIGKKNYSPNNNNKTRKHKKFGKLSQYE
jgi:hypothetical protein